MFLTHSQVRFVYFPYERMVYHTTMNKENKLARGQWPVKKTFQTSTRGVQPFFISGPHWKNKSCLGAHSKYTNANKNKQAKSRNVLRKLTILCWTTFIATLGHVWPMGHMLDTPNCCSSLVGRILIYKT